MRRLDAMIEKRQQLVAAYRDKLSGITHLRLFTEEFDSITAPHLFVVQIDFEACGTSRTEVMGRLVEGGIGSQVHYIPLYRHPFFTKKSGDIREYFPNMEAYYTQALSLPLYYDLTEEDVDRVAVTLKTSCGL